MAYTYGTRAAAQGAGAGFFIVWTASNPHLSFASGGIMLNDKLFKLPAVNTVLMVTHQVVIQAITGRSVPSGGGVIYTPAQAHSTDLTF